MNTSPYSEYITVYTREDAGKQWEANHEKGCIKVLLRKMKGKNGGLTFADGAWVYPLRIVGDQYKFILTGVKDCYFLEKKPFVHDYSI